MFTQGGRKGEKSPENFHLPKREEWKFILCPSPRKRIDFNFLLDGENELHTI